MKALKSILLVSTILSLISCGNDDEPANRTPETFNLIDVTNGTTGVGLLPNFTWAPTTDPDGDPVTYDLYLDSNENPTTLFAGDISTTSYQAEERLSLINQYYWKVVAKDNKGNATESEDTYSFTTRNLNFPNTSVTANAAFSGRSSHTTAVFDNKLWVIGGYDGNRKNDVWFSADGSTWTQATNNAAFSERHFHTTTVFDNKLWVIGGFDGNRKNDVWYSTDGSTWTQMTDNAAFSGRLGHTTAVFDNKLWVIGGSSDGSRKNDVWYSTDGSTWVQASANAAFFGRESHATAVFNNKLWVIGGRIDSGGSYENDVWYSTDGSTWRQTTDNASFSKRRSFSTPVFDNKLWVIGGFDALLRNDVWYME